MIKIISIYSCIIAMQSTHIKIPLYSMASFINNKISDCCIDRFIKTGSVPFSA